MSHHLNINQREDVHTAHMRRDGHASFLIATATQTFQLGLVESRPFSFTAELSFEICMACGWMTRPDCQHGEGTGKMMWTHRPGCPDTRSHPLPYVYIPPGLVKTFGEAFPDSPSGTCEGCLLICPICGADGT